LKQYLLKIGILFLLVSLEIFPQDFLQEGIDLYSKGKFEDAEKIFENILNDNSENAQANFYMGLISIKLNNDYDKAEDYLEEAVDQAPDSADYHYWLGVVYGTLARDASIFSQVSLASGCKDEFESAVKLNPKHIQARIGLIQYLIQAPGIMGGSMEDAEKNIEKLKELSLYDYYAMKTTFALHEEKYDDAINYIQKAITADSTRLEGYNTLGYLYLQYSKDPQKAIAVFKQMVNVKPDNANSYDSLGDGYFHAKIYDEALSSYKKALEINPTFFPSMFNLGRVYDTMNNKQDAVKWYKKYLSKADEGKLSDLARERIDALE
jgi:tetratricopeptide (TPR) repeat protein